MKLSKLLFFLFIIMIPIQPFKINKMEMIIKAKLCRICYSKLTVFNISRNKMFNIYDNYIYINEKKTKSVCYIFYNNKTIDVCFKGTSSITDICFNINAYPKLFINNKIRLHNGFLLKYLAIKDEIISNLKEIIKKNDINEISFNGYSAGGAIANIASLDMSYIFKNLNIKCITFGSPRVGNIHFIKTYNEKIVNSIRIINKNDIIPLVPPPIIYRHIHEPLVIKNKKDNNHWTFNIYNYFKYTHSIMTYIKNLY